MTEVRCLCEQCKMTVMQCRGRSAKSDAVLDTLRGISDTKLEVFLEWIADRMIYVYHEPENIDFVLSLRKRAKQARELRSQQKER